MEAACRQAWFGQLCGWCLLAFPRTEPGSSSTTTAHQAHHLPGIAPISSNLCRESLQRLGLEYLDLFLMHWPVVQGQKSGSAPDPPLEVGLGT